MKKFSFAINGHDYDVEIKNVDENIAEVEVNGFTYQVEFDRTISSSPISKTPKIVRSEVIPSTDITPSEQKTSSPSTPKGTGHIKSPLPGVVLDLSVSVGDKVKIGDKILVLEAMKMENTINSDKDGIITAIKVKKGENVMEGDTLIEIS